ncbi:isoprenoid biosynthesis glyoxalase ElbB [Labilibacter sediminis]|nr:isoprenoid biosynthesis glyoxalase ElbB [Labilibacter sediminis]
MKQIAIILSGCGVFDGAEIHEATLTMLSIAKNEASYTCFAPDIRQHHVINHITGEEINQERNVLVESARIARGNIKNINELDVNKFDALVMPGGFGVAKNLCDFAFKGSDCDVIPELKKVVTDFWKTKKPIGALCISPALIAKVLPEPIVTIGNDANTILEIEKLNAKHEITSHGEITVDHKNKLITTPCYMLDANISQIEQGVDNLVKELLKMM